MQVRLGTQASGSLGGNSPHNLSHFLFHMNINPSLVLVRPRKTRPFITERLLMGRKESNQTNKKTISYEGET